jgi:hypothetical protein
MLLCAEALDLNGAEATLILSEQLGFQELIPNRVELWKRRCHNPLRRQVRRGILATADSDALIRILCTQCERLYPLLRALLSAAEPEPIARLAGLVRERMNPRRGGVQRLLDGAEGAQQRRQLILAMALAAGNGGFARLKASLMDAGA